MNSIPRLLHGLSFLVALLGTAAGSNAAEARGARRLPVLNYPNCLALENGATRAVLCPDAGGRVLEYSWKGVNALHLDPRESEWRPGADNRKVPMSAGRFDIGPEQIIPRREELWSGVWQGEITGDRAARLTSARNAATGVQLVREFTLAADSSRLVCRQIIRNVSDRVVEWCHWSRTFAVGGGLCVIPVSQPSRFPAAYVMYEKSGINFRPQDENIRMREGYLEILAAPAFPKLGMDSTAGWFAYQMKSDLLMVKRYRTFPDRVYNEVAGLTISIWYPKDNPVCELEPIGPRERLRPGESASFVEEWWLLENPFPAAGQNLDLKRVQSLVDTRTTPPVP